MVIIMEFELCFTLPIVHHRITVAYMQYFNCKGDGGMRPTIKIELPPHRQSQKQKRRVTKNFFYVCSICKSESLYSLPFRGLYLYQQQTASILDTGWLKDRVLKPEQKLTHVAFVPSESAQPDQITDIYINLFFLE